jgi:hypothetical protein
VLALTPRGAAASMVERLGGWVADPSSVEDASNALADAIDTLAGQPARWPFGAPDVRAAYRVEAVGARFAALIDELV